MFRWTVASLLGAGVACQSQSAPPTPTPTTSVTAVSPPPPAPTTPAPTTAAPTTPSAEAVTVHLAPPSSCTERAILSVSDGDGAYLSTTEVDGAEVLVLPTVPTGGFVTWAEWYDCGYGTSLIFLDSVAEIQPGDELWFAGSNEVSGFFGEYETSVPSAPPVGYNTWGLSVANRGVTNAGLPYSASTNTTLHPGTLLHAWAAAFAAGQSLPVAVAYAKDVAVGGPTDPAPLVQLGAWTSSYGVAEVVYEHTGDPGTVALTVDPTRGGWSAGGVRAQGAVAAGDTLVVAAPAHDDFHDTLSVELAEYTSYVTGEPSFGALAEIRTTALPVGASTETYHLDGDDLPPLPVDFTVTASSRTATLPLPAGWNCGGREANATLLVLEGANQAAAEYQAFTWRMTGGYRAEWTLPQIDPALELELGTFTDLVLSAGVYSVDGGHDTWRGTADRLALNEFFWPVRPEVFVSPVCLASVSP